MIPAEPHYMLSGFRIPTRDDNMRPGSVITLIDRIFVLDKWLLMTSIVFWDAALDRSCRTKVHLDDPQNMLTTLQSNIESDYPPGNSWSSDTSFG